MQTGWAETSAGRIFWRESGSGTRTVVLVHGNSGSSEIFSGLLAGVPQGWRFIAVDLAGHGNSSNAAVPERDYTLSGHAEYLSALISRLRVDRPVLLGFSLGGHIALELLDRLHAVAGLVLVASPPFQKTPESLSAAFLPGEALGIATREHLSVDDVARFAALHGDLLLSDAQNLMAAIARSDGKSRLIVGGSLLRPEARDQYELAVANTVPTAVVIGGNDPMVSLGYLTSVPFGTLWRRQVQIIPDAGHAVHLTHPEAFATLLRDFLADSSRVQANASGE